MALARGGSVASRRVARARFLWRWNRAERRRSRLRNDCGSRPAAERVAWSETRVRKIGAAKINYYFGRGRRVAAQALCRHRKSDFFNRAHARGVANVETRHRWRWPITRLTDRRSRPGRPSTAPPTPAPPAAAAANGTGTARGAARSPARPPRDPAARYRSTRCRRSAAPRSARSRGRGRW